MFQQLLLQMLNLHALHKLSTGVFDFLTTLSRERRLLHEDSTRNKLLKQTQDHISVIPRLWRRLEAPHRLVHIGRHPQLLHDLPQWRVRRGALPDLIGDMVARPLPAIVANGNHSIHSLLAEGLVSENLAEEEEVDELCVGFEALGPFGEKLAGVQPVDVAAEGVGFGVVENYALGASPRVVEQRLEDI